MSKGTVFPNYPVQCWLCLSEVLVSTLCIMFLVRCLYFFYTAMLICFIPMNTQINFYPKETSYSGQFTPCWKSCHHFSMLITVCNSLNSLNKDVSLNSGHFLLKESSSYLTFWIWKSSIKFCLEEIFTAIFPQSYLKSCAFTQSRHVFFQKTLSASNGHSPNLPKILAKDLCLCKTLLEL